MRLRSLHCRPAREYYVHYSRVSVESVDEGVSLPVDNGSTLSFMHLHRTWRCFNALHGVSSHVLERKEYDISALQGLGKSRYIRRHRVPGRMADNSWVMIISSL